MVFVRETDPKDFAKIEKFFERAVEVVKEVTPIPSTDTAAVAQQLVIFDASRTPFMRAGRPDYPVPLTMEETAQEHQRYAASAQLAISRKP